MSNLTLGVTPFTTWERYQPLPHTLLYLRWTLGLATTPPGVLEITHHQDSVALKVCDTKCPFPHTGWI